MRSIVASLPRPDRRVRHARAHARDPQRASWADTVHEPVSFVNAPMLARERGLTVSEMRSTVSQDYVSLDRPARRDRRGPGERGGHRSSGGGRERVTQVNDFDIEVTPAGHMVFFTYVDRPGIIGKVGTMLGEHDINIATMDVGRKAEGGEALMCLTVDTEVPAEVLEQRRRSRSRPTSCAPSRCRVAAPHLRSFRHRTVAVYTRSGHEADLLDDRRCRQVRCPIHRAALPARSPGSTRPAPPPQGVRFMSRSPRSNLRRLAIGRLISVTGGAAAFTALDVHRLGPDPLDRAGRRCTLLLTFGVAGLHRAARRRAWATASIAARC